MSDERSVLIAPYERLSSSSLIPLTHDSSLVLIMDSLTYIQLLRRNRSFRRLWWGQVISELGNWFNFIAGLGLVRMISHGDAGVTTIILLSRMVPFTLFAPLAGAFVDRW